VGLHDFIMIHARHHRSSGITKICVDQIRVERSDGLRPVSRQSIPNPAPASGLQFEADTIVHGERALHRHSWELRSPPLRPKVIEFFLEGVLPYESS
jgi:hypothetical protein